MLQQEKAVFSYSPPATQPAQVLPSHITITIFTINSNFTALYPHIKQQTVAKKEGKKEQEIFQKFLLVFLYTAALALFLYLGLAKLEVG
jgi:hypothetical protein